MTMASPRPRRKKIPLFSPEARKLLTAPGLVVSSGGVGREGGEEGGETQQEREHQSLVADHTSSFREPECLSCHVTFGCREEQVEHYTLDWHRYNLKQRLRGLERVDQDQFEKMAGDLSSISGSESDSDTDYTPPPDSTHPQLTSGSRPPGGVACHTPFLHFTPDGTTSGGSVGSHTHSVYRCVVPGGGEGSDEHLCSDLRQLGAPVPPVWLVLMRSGGHFAGAVYRGSVLEAYKTFHRYTVRAKRGTAQSVRDAQQGGHKPKSAGASLRRYNEAALMAEMRGLMESWSAYTREASCIFLRTPKHCRGVLVGERGGGAPLVRGDPRLREIPFSTRRPTLKEVAAAHARLATVYVGVAPGSSSPVRPAVVEKAGLGNKGAGLEEKVVEMRLAAPSRRVLETSNRAPPNNDLLSGDADLNTDLDTGDPAADEGGRNGRGKRKRKGKKKGAELSSKEPEVQLPQFIQDLLSACTSQDNADTSDSDHVTTVTSALKGAGLQPISTASGSSSGSDHTPKPHPQLQLLNSKWNGDTVLHTAAANGHSSLIPILMEHGSDPALKNDSGHTPYLVAKNKSVRDSFRRFMAQFPEAYDYGHAHVPSPLTQEMEEGRSRKEAEKRKEKKKARKQKEKVKKEEKELVRCEEAQQQAVSSLSDREKRAMAAEKRMVAGQASLASSVLSRVGGCSGCGKSLVGVVPFERLDFKYCSMECLRQHRKQLSQQ